MNFLKYALPLFLAASALGAVESKAYVITCTGTGRWAAERFVIHHQTGASPTLDQLQESSTPGAAFTPVTVEGSARVEGEFTVFEFDSPLRGENARYKTVHSLRINTMYRAGGTYHGQHRQCNEFLSMLWSNDGEPEDFALKCTYEE